MPAAINTPTADAQKVTATITSQSRELAATLARPELLALEPYQSARRLGGQGEVWINANESPFNHTDIDRVNRYPECQPPEVIAAYAAYAGVSDLQLICSRGADEAIELLIRTFCTPGADSIALFGPTYGMYAISAATFNVEVKALSLDDNFQLPKALTQAQGAKLLFICNPNNPTGTWVSQGEILRILEAMPDTLVVVDEAYIEFSPELSAASLLKEYPNLVVLRTLSKAFALAGARCGFMLANEGIIEMVKQVLAPYPVPVPVARLAALALSPEGIARMQADVALLKTQGQRVAAALERLGARVLPSGGNYLLAYFADAPKMREQLQRFGIVARSYRDPRLVDAIRFSFSDDSDTERLLAALSQVQER
ncbi:histidinol-phosphate transaminase [Shewanella algae]|uniref:histidinol-phosphate transaminase n=1 Tax=Shewanella algae TaxID=38313 RepID=UPI001AAC8F1C|nr:histidinol-phosphate transaminase [Shewanella algae]MBO2616444.1 histidinol-phosphate transaminase [Shewanella algae]